MEEVGVSRLSHFNTLHTLHTVLSSPRVSLSSLFSPLLLPAPCLLAAVAAHHHHHHHHIIISYPYHN